MGRSGQRRRKRRKRKEKLALEEKTKEDRSTRKMDRGQLSKRKNPPTDALEHLVEKKERQAGEALENVGQVDLGFRPRVLDLGF
jgi:hypothetical protein